MLNPAPAASSADKEEYPQANGCRPEANNQEDSSNSTLVVEEPTKYEHTDIINNMIVPIKDLLGTIASAVIGTQSRIRNYLSKSEDAAVAQSRGKGRGDCRGCKRDWLPKAVGRLKKYRARECRAIRYNSGQCNKENRVNAHRGLSRGMVEAWSAAELTKSLVRLRVLVGTTAELREDWELMDDGEGLLLDGATVSRISVEVNGEILGIVMTEVWIVANDDAEREAEEAKVRGSVDGANEDDCEEDGALGWYSEISTRANSN